jgi:hypothetical protein
METSTSFFLHITWSFSQYYTSKEKHQQQTTLVLACRFGLRLIINSGAFLHCCNLHTYTCMTNNIVGWKSLCSLIKTFKMLKFFKDLFFICMWWDLKKRTHRTPRLRIIFHVVNMDLLPSWIDWLATLMRVVNCWSKFWSIVCLELTF